MAERRVSLFRNGSNQAVRIPREFELPGKEAIMRSEDGRLVIEPLPSDSFVEYLKRMEPVTEEWPEIDAPPRNPWSYDPLPSGHQHPIRADARSERESSGQN